MYGVPSDLSLAIFNNATLIQICIGRNDLQFHFDPHAEIGVEGKWELSEQSGLLVDQSEEHSKREYYRLHQILIQKVVSGEVNAPVSFSLHFANGFTLTIYDDPKEYESFSIEPGDIFV